MRGIIRELQTGGEEVTIIDMEAGLENLKRGTPRYTDALLVVAEPYFRSAETALRLLDLGRELGIPWVGVVANKIRDDEDEQLVRKLFDRDGAELVAVIPQDEAVTKADRGATSVIDVDPSSDSVRAVERVADRLEELERDRAAAGESL